MIRAIFFDFGGVLMRTEYQSPRQHLAERLNMEYDDLVRLVFDSEVSRQASIGAATVEEHWDAVMKKLNRPASEAKSIRDEFFAGDILDRTLVELIRSLRKSRKYKTGLISNAWNDLRALIEREKIDDAFDTMIISAEVGVMKPDAKIFKIALDQLKVPAREAMFVDDFIENIEGCQKVGMKGLHFQNAETDIEKLKALL
ncbi:MAG: HAD family phosphatase [Chloroflexota bacterium]